jgi:uncharacterized membrane protein
MSTGIISIRSSGDVDVFPLSQNTCTGPINPGEGCSLEIRFAPTRAGSYAATFTASDGTFSATVTVSGSGL